MNTTIKAARSDARHLRSNALPVEMSIHLSIMGGNLDFTGATVSPDIIHENIHEARVAQLTRALAFLEDFRRYVDARRNEAEGEYLLWKVRGDPSSTRGGILRIEADYADAQDATERARQAVAEDK